MLCGVVCEYNPFHKGHQLQIRWLKDQGHDVVCVMSGSFVQRGEPAIYDKWSRTRWALAAGADLVLELPVIYSLQSAQGFARGAISLLRCAGVEAVCFGAEHPDLAQLTAIARLQISQPTEYQNLLKDSLTNGLSYPRAMEAATRAMLPQLTDGVFAPNNLLAVEYLKAMSELDWRPQVLPLLRKADGFSAAECRNALLSGSIPASLLPGFVFSDLGQLTPLSLVSFSSHILYLLRTAKKEHLTELIDVSEGLENRLITSAADAVDLSHLLALSSGKRYTHARIKRILCSMLLDVKKADLAPYLQNPPYLRILGFRKESARLLGTMKESSHAPFADSIQAIRYHPVFQKEVQATELCSAYTRNQSGRDFREPLTVL